MGSHWAQSRRRQDRCGGLPRRPNSGPRPPESSHPSLQLPSRVAPQPGGRTLSAFTSPSRGGGPGPGGGGLPPLGPSALSPCPRQADVDPAPTCRGVRLGAGRGLRLYRIGPARGPPGPPRPPPSPLRLGWLRLGRGVCGPSEGGRPGPARRPEGRRTAGPAPDPGLVVSFFSDRNGVIVGDGKLRRVPTMGTGSCRTVKVAGFAGMARPEGTPVRLFAVRGLTPLSALFRGAGFARFPPPPPVQGGAHGADWVSFVSSPGVGESGVFEGIAAPESS